MQKLRFYGFHISTDEIRTRPFSNIRIEIIFLYFGPRFIYNVAYRFMKIASFVYTHMYGAYRRVLVAAGSLIIGFP